MKQNKVRFLIMCLLVVNIYESCCAWDDNLSSAKTVIAQACTAGLALAGIVGAAALVAWCLSETDEQLVIRLDHECIEADLKYKDMLSYLEKSVNFYSSSVDSTVLINSYSELTLYEIATAIVRTGASQSSYRSSLYSTKTQLHSSLNKLRDRVYDLEKKILSHEEEKKLKSMRSLVKNARLLIKHITFLSDYLEHHKGYFNLYETINIIRNNYAHCFAIIEQEAYPEIYLKNGILSSMNSRYPFVTFVKTIDSHIFSLDSAINSLRHTYETARKYGIINLNQLIWMKNVVMLDTRYAQECYQQEQERLQALQLQALQSHARI